MKIKWLERRIMAVLSDLPLLIMLAEPGLSMQGSPLYTLEENVIVNTLNEVLGATRQFTMIHCCGNIDWPILMHTDVSIINFDAYQHSDRFIIYHDELSEYLEKGKMIAWGIVPTTEEEFRKESVPGLVSRFENILHALIDRGFQRQFLLSSALITPSCSTAGLSVHMAEEVYKTTLDVANALRAKYFGDVTESQK
jgi:hypothetical protein